MGILVFDKHPCSGSGEAGPGRSGKAVEKYTIVMDGPDDSTEAIRMLFPEQPTKKRRWKPIRRST